MDYDPYRKNQLEDIWLNMVQTILSNKEGYYHGLDPYVAADMALTAFKLRFRG